MAGPQVTSPKFKLGRWLLVLSVLTIALGGFAFWDSRREKLRFVEPIWSDSLPGHENDAATGQRRKIGEVWALTHSSGLTLWGRGLSRDFSWRFPVFSSSVDFQRDISDQLLSEAREDLLSVNAFRFADWWHSAKNHHLAAWSISASVELIYVGEHAISLQIRRDLLSLGLRGDSSPDVRNFVNIANVARVVELRDLFRGRDWENHLADALSENLRQQPATSMVKASIRRWESSARKPNSLPFALTALGLQFYIDTDDFEPTAKSEFKVIVPYELVNENLRPDGPHRLFQAKVSE